MALKATMSGTYNVRTQKEAIEALGKVEELKTEIEELKREHGISEMEYEAVELKKAAQAWFVKTGTESLPMGKKIARLIQAVGKRTWVWSKRDLPDEAVEGATPLRDILQANFSSSDYREIARRITKRVVDPEKLDEAIAEGLLDEDLIAPAYVEKLNAPYLRVFENSHG